MKNKKEEEIERKLKELEAAIIKETPPVLKESTQLSNIPKSSDLQAPDQSVSAERGAPTTSPGSDICFFSGLCLVGLGIVMLFQHVRVGTGFMNMLGLGGHGIGLLAIALMVGIGWLFYDSKSKIAWMITIGGCAAIVLGVLSSLVMNFPSLTLLSLIMMLLPFAAGGALLLKGMGGPKGVEAKVKGELTKKDD